MSKEKANANDGTATEMVASNREQNVEVAPANLLKDLPLNADTLTFLKQAQQIETEIEMLNIEFTKPTDLLNIPLRVLDCIGTEIPDKDELKSVVLFKVEEMETGIVHHVMQSANTIRLRYVELFANRKLLAQASSRPVPTLDGYQFVEDPRYVTAGNTAIVLKKV